MPAVFTDARCLRHEAPAGYPESAERLLGILTLLRAGAFAVHEPGEHPRTEAAILAVHEEAYVRRFARAVERGDGLLDSADNPLSRGTWDAARGAVSAALWGADWIAAVNHPESAQRVVTAESGRRVATAESGRRVVTAESGRSALAAVRPPGHHAECGLAMGFCFFNNVAIAAQHLIDEHHVGRLAIFDFDVHHGNGTQHIFEERADVLYLSTHQFPFYPGTGAASERGIGPGLGATVNVPLRAGCGDAEYAQAITETVLPALRRFAPEVLLLSAGFDAWRADPLGGMQVTGAGFAEWGRMLGDFAAETCDGRLLAVLEGGYDLEALPGLVEGHLAAYPGHRGHKSPAPAR